jgi:hypothetical protein
MVWWQYNPKINMATQFGARMCMQSYSGRVHKEAGSSKQCPQLAGFMDRKMSELKFGPRLVFIVGPTLLEEESVGAPTLRRCMVCRL